MKSMACFIPPTCTITEEQRRYVAELTVKLTKDAVAMEFDDREAFIARLRARVGDEDYDIKFADLLESMICKSLKSGFF